MKYSLQFVFVYFCFTLLGTIQSQVAQYLLETTLKV